MSKLTDLRVAVLATDGFHYQPVGAQPSLIRKDYGLILDAANEELVPMPLAGLIHDRLTATIAKGRQDVDWAGFAREVSENAGV